MYRNIMIKCGMQPNAIYRKSELIVTKRMKIGERVVLSDRTPLRRIYRDLDERLEVDRLAKVAREHAMRN